MGDTAQKLYIRRKKYPSGNIGVIFIDKINGKLTELQTTALARDVFVGLRIANIGQKHYLAEVCQVLLVVNTKYES